MTSHLDNATWVVPGGTASSPVLDLNKYLVANLRHPTDPSTAPTPTPTTWATALADPATTAAVGALVAALAELFKRRKQRRESQDSEMEEEVRRRVRGELRRLGVTYSDIGESAGYSAETVRAQISGRRPIASSTVEAITSLAAESEQGRPAAVPDPRIPDAAAINQARDRGSLVVEEILRSSGSLPAAAFSQHSGKPSAGSTLKHGGGSARVQVSGTQQNRTRVMVPAQGPPAGPQTWRSVPPDPTTAETVAEFHARLAELRVWAGDLSLRRLVARNPGRLSRSTLSDMFRGTDRLPKHALLRDYVLACGAGSEWPRWDLAWQRLKNAAAQP